MRVLILRPSELIEETVEEFRKEGIETYGCPFIELRYLDFEVPEHDFAIITSQNLAKRIVEKSIRLNKVIAIGKKTANILRNAGYDVLVPKKFESRAIVEEFSDLLRGKKVLVIRSDYGSDALREISKIADCTEIIGYRIVKLKGKRQREEIEKVKAKFYDVVVFSSRMIAESFLENCDSECIKKLREITLIAIGSPTAEFLKFRDFNVLIPEEYSFDGVLKLIKSLKDADFRC
ncbi:MAG: uroporphyrinogen-III synthase [Archaeoglobaceae archaeon]